MPLLDIFSLEQLPTIPYTQIQNVTADRILGRVSTSGSIQELTASQIRTLINVADGANNYTLPAATSTVRGGVELFSDTVQTVAANAVTATASRTYGIQVNSSGQMVVNVPWSDSNTTYSTATSTVQGLVELFSDTVQTVAANAVTATASRTYGVQLNSAGQMVVNVPWVDTNTVYTHPAYTTRSIDTSGAEIIDVFTSDAIGSVTNITTRTLTLADLGYTGATNADNYSSWLIAASGTAGTGTVSSGTTVTLTAGSNVTITRSGTTVTIASTDTNTTYSTATSTVQGLVELFSDTVQTTAANAVTTTASRTYGIQLNSAGQMVVNVPWSDTNTTYSAATSTTLGLVELFSDTVQTTAANAVTTTASRTYGIQVNSAGQMVVNVPWSDTNTTYSAGNGISLSGTTFSVAAGTGLTQEASGLAHADTSTQASLTALTGANVVSDIDVDGFGHVTALATRALTAGDIGAASSSHNHTLDSLSNVTITSNTSGELLKWNGSAWINNTLAEAGIQAALTNPVTGTGTSGYLPKFTGSTTVGNSLLYDTGAVLVLGGTAGEGGINVRGNNNSFQGMAIGTTAQAGLRVYNNTTSASSTLFQYAKIYNSEVGGTHLGTNVANTAIFMADGADLTAVKYGTLSTATNAIIQFGTQNTERMRITAGGNVLIGTTTDAGGSNKLQVNGNITATQATATDQVVVASRNVTAGTGLTGGGNLTADRTLSISSTYAIDKFFLSKGVKTVAEYSWNPGTSQFEVGQNDYSWDNANYGIRNAIHWESYGVFTKGLGTTNFTVGWSLNGTNYTIGTESLSFGGATPIPYFVKGHIYITNTTTCKTVFEIKFINPNAGTVIDLIKYGDVTLSGVSWEANDFPVNINFQFPTNGLSNFKEYATSVYVY